MSDAPDNKPHGWYGAFRTTLSVLFVAALYILGVLHWCAFFDWGDVSLRAYDWPKEVGYLDVQRHALRTGELPWHISHPFHGSDRFLALPETNLLPHALLLPWVNNRTFLIVNVAVLYTVGFLGCLWIRARYRLGDVAFAFLVMLTNFNGYIVSHLSVGHSMWGGCFFLPFFALFLLEWSERGPSLPLTLKLALCLFAMMLQGAFHLVNWCWIFFLFFILFRPGWWWQGFLVFLFSGLLSVCRIVPAAVAFWGSQEYSFTSGYPTATDLLLALVVIREHTHEFAGHYVPLGWWEYDVYIGLVAFGTLVYGGVWLRLSPDPVLDACRFSALDVPLLAQTFLSVGPIYAAVAELPIPLANAERVSSRFVIVPLIVLVVIAAIRMQRVLEKTPWSAGLGVLLGGLLVETAVTLGWHSWRWRVGVHDTDPFRIFEDIQLQAGGEPEAWYFATVAASAAVSALAFVVLLVLWWRALRR
jgi:hypothetical protein